MLARALLTALPPTGPCSVAVMDSRAIHSIAARSTGAAGKNLSTRWTVDSLPTPYNWVLLRRRNRSGRSCRRLTRLARSTIDRCILLSTWEMEAAAFLRFSAGRDRR